MVLYDEERNPGEVVKIVSDEVKVRVIWTPLGLRAEMKLEWSLFKVLSHTWHIINRRCILPCLLCILKLKSYKLLFSPWWTWFTQFLEWKSSGSGSGSPSKKWLHHQFHWHAAQEQGQGLSLLQKTFRTYFHFHFHIPLGQLFWETTQKKNYRSHTQNWKKYLLNITENIKHY